MAGEDRGLYILLDGVLYPAATIRGSKGDKGNQGDVGDEGPVGPQGTGIWIGPTEPDPADHPVWIKTTS